MRWVVEVSSIGKTDLQKFCVEAESWQRALQAARAQRGEDGPMSGFSIELLDEGYRAVDPLARVRFVVKRAPDDMPITAPLAKDGKSGVAPSALVEAAKTTSVAGTTKTTSVPPAAPSSSAANKSGPPRPGATIEKSSTNGTTAKKGPASPNDEPPASLKQPPASTQGPAAPAAPAVGSALPGLPSIKLLASREQNPTETSPLTYREYSFAVPSGTSEVVAAEVLRQQLKLVDAHLVNAKMGKLVNLAAFDVEFTGKPPAPPIATLSWKDWKGEPIIGFPRRGAAEKQVKPPTGTGPQSSGPASIGPLFPPPSMPPANLGAAPPPAAATPAIVDHAAVAAPPSTVPMVVQAQRPPAPQPAPVASGSVPPPAHASVPLPAPAHASVPPPPAHASVPPPPAPVHASVPPPPAPVHASVPPPAPAQQVGGSVPPPATAGGSVPPPAVRTPSGRFVRGRTSGDELITALFESMHDLHFLRDALDGGQFCLALATEVLPARAAFIHFFDIEKREWVIACTRGKDTTRLLTLRSPESDEHLRQAARSRRAIVTANVSTAAQRYEALGGTKSMIVAPIMQAGRALGAIEIINPLDGMPFNEDEGNAMTYIAEQYAEYLGSRGIVLDRDRIQKAAART